jgi:hypothetical protein
VLSRSESETVLRTMGARPRKAECEKVDEPWHMGRLGSAKVGLDQPSDRRGFYPESISEEITNRRRDQDEA